MLFGKTRLDDTAMDRAYARRFCAWGSSQGQPDPSANLVSSFANDCSAPLILGNNQSRF